MPLDFEIISFGIALFFLLLVAFLTLLRLSNRLVAAKLNVLAEKQKGLEDLNKKLAQTVMESKKELEKKIQAVKKELGTVEIENAVVGETALAGVGRRH